MIRCFYHKAETVNLLVENIPLIILCHYNIQYLLTSSPSSPRPLHISFTSSFSNFFRRQFLSNTWLIQLPFLCFVVRRTLLFFLDSKQYFIFHTICPNDLLYHSPGPHSRTFNVYLSSEVSAFQHHTKPCSKCINSLANTINTVGTSDITMSVNAGINPIIGFWHIMSHWQDMIPRWNTFYRSDSQETVKPAVGNTTYIIMQR
jgi:hypothetical protein